MNLDFTPIPQNITILRGPSWQFDFRLPAEVTNINLNDFTIKAYIWLNNSIIETLAAPTNIVIAENGKSFFVKKEWVNGDGTIIDDLISGTLQMQILVTDAAGRDYIPAYFNIHIVEKPTESAERASFDTHYVINVVDGAFYILGVDSLYNLTVEASEEAVSAKSFAVSAKDTAVTARNESVAAKDTAVTARNESVAAKDTAVTARNESVSAKDLSVTALNEAVTAKEIAQTKASEAAASASLLQNYFVEVEEKGDFLGDEDGYVFMEVTLENGLKTAYDIPAYTDENVISLLESRFGIFEADEDAICDSEGYVVQQITQAGVENVQSTTTNTSTTTLAKPKLPAIYLLLTEQGQSLSNSGASAVAVDMYNTKMFAGGINTSYDPDTPGAADAYFGTGLVPCATSGTETQMKRLARVWKDLLRDENGIAIEEQEVTFVINSAGSGGISLAAIADKNGDYYRRTLEAMRRLRDFAIADGKTANCPVFVYVQGENSADKADSIAAHYAKIESLFDNFNADAKAIFNQPNDMQFIIYQIASFPQNPGATVNVPLAQLKIALEKTNVHFGCAMYQMEYSDPLHGSTVTYQKMGGLMGVVAKRIISDEVKMKPIYPKSWTIQSNTAGTLYTLAVKFDVPVEPLVFDTSVNSLYLSVPTHYGFSILSAGVEIIQSARIEYGNTIVFVCSQNPSGKELTYAIGGRDAGGNLRDSQGEKIKIPTDVGMLPAHNWSPIFKITI